jgi:hypothetical protein
MDTRFDGAGGVSYAGYRSQVDPESAVGRLAETDRAPIVQRPRTPPFQGGNAGSNPVGSTQYIKALWRSWLARRPVTAKVAGSSPVRVASTFGWSRRSRPGSSVGTSVRLKSGRSPVRPRPWPLSTPDLRKRSPVRGFFVAQCSVTLRFGGSEYAVTGHLGGPDRVRGSHKPYEHERVWLGIKKPRPDDAERPGLCPYSQATHCTAWTASTALAMSRSTSSGWEDHRHVVRRDLDGRGVHAGGELALGHGRDRLVPVGNQEPRWVRPPGGDAHHFVDGRPRQRLLHGVHDSRFDRVDVGREVVHEVVLGQATRSPARRRPGAPLPGSGDPAPAACRSFRPRPSRTPRCRPDRRHSVRPPQSGDDLTAVRVAGEDGRAVLTGQHQPQPCFLTRAG